MKALALALILGGCAAVGASVAPEKPADLSGMYLAEGKNPDGSEYQAAVAIEAKGEVYALTWELGQGSAIGLGMVQKDVLAVIYAPSVGGPAALIAYAVNGDTLVGKWTIPGEPGVGTETLTKRGTAHKPAKTKPGQRIKV